MMAAVFSIYAIVNDHNKHDIHTCHKCGEGMYCSEYKVVDGVAYRTYKCFKCDYTITVAETLDVTDEPISDQKTDVDIRIS